MVSYHDYNERGRSAELLQRLLEGKSVALISDAGMPAIADPGYRLVKAATEAGVRVVPVPGPSAAITALAVSGLPSDRFVFEGFLPRKPSHRRKRLELLKEEARTLIFYESPYRIVSTLTDVLAIFGDRQLCVCRELTKTYEEILNVTASEAIMIFTQKKQPKGEFTIVIAGSDH